jgi:hypothetical protein
VLQLERHGFDARVDPEVRLHYTDHHAYDPEAPVQARLLVLRDQGAEAVDGVEGVELIAHAGGRGAAGTAQARADALVAEMRAEGGSDEEVIRAVDEVLGDDMPETPLEPIGFAAELSVFLDERPPGSGSWLVPR